MKLKNTLAFLGLTLSLGLSAQNIKPLRTKYENINQGDYLKDSSKSFDKYLGKWKSTYRELEIEFIIYKQEKVAATTPFQNTPYFTDRVYIDYIIYKNGAIVDKRYKAIKADYESKYNTLNGTVSDIDCGIGGGLIILTPVNSTKITAKFNEFTELVDVRKCPHVDNIKVYLPSEKITFTKQ